MKVLVLNGSPHKEGNTAALQATMTRFYAIVAEGDKLEDLLVFDPFIRHFEGFLQVQKYSFQP